MDKTSISRRLFMKQQKSSTSIVLLVIVTIALFYASSDSLFARDYDFSLSLQAPAALKANVGDLVEFSVDFKNEGTMNDTYTYYAGSTKAITGWSLQACFDSMGTCWDPQPEGKDISYNAGGTDLVHVSVFLNTTIATTECYLKVVSQATGKSKIVYMTASNEANPAIRTMIYTNLDRYSVGDEIQVHLRRVNLGDNLNADTYVAFIHGSDVYWFKRNGELTKDLGPYNADTSYETTYVDDSVILRVPITAPLGLDYLVLGTVMTTPASLNLISDISTTTITFSQ